MHVREDTPATTCDPHPVRVEGMDANEVSGTFLGGSGTRSNFIAKAR